MKQLFDTTQFEKNPIDKNYYSLKDAAKELNMPFSDFIERLKNCTYIGRNSKGYWMPTKLLTGFSYAVVKQIKLKNEQGNEFVKEQMLITKKGLDFFKMRLWRKQ